MKIRYMRYCVQIVSYICHHCDQLLKGLLRQTHHATFGFGCFLRVWEARGNKFLSISKRNPSICWFLLVFLCFQRVSYSKRQRLRCTTVGNPLEFQAKSRKLRKFIKNPQNPKQSKGFRLEIERKSFPRASQTRRKSPNPKVA